MCDMLKVLSFEHDAILFTANGWFHRIHHLIRIRVDSYFQILFLPISRNKQHKKHFVYASF
jgi:hypothetical protein